MDRDEDDRRSPAENLVAGSLVDRTGVGKPLSERTLQRQRTVEGYLLGEAMPRYMQRAREIERGLSEQERRLRAAHARLRADCAGDAARFEREWEARVATWDLEPLNALIRQHNEWYPIERDLPMDPRTGDYVLVHGRPYQRALVDADWIRGLFGSI